MLSTNLIRKLFFTVYIVYVSMYVHIYICTYVHIFMYRKICAHTSCACVYMYIRTYIHMRTY